MAEFSSLSYSMIHSDKFLNTIQDHLHGVVPPTVEWTLPPQIINLENSHTGLLPDSPMEAFFSIEDSSSQITPAYVKLTKNRQTNTKTTN